jgi:hypothetical protein
MYLMVLVLPDVFQPPDYVAVAVAAAAVAPGDDPPPLPH